MPRSVEVILSDDLVDSVRPGDQCSIVGTYHARSATSFLFWLHQLVTIDTTVQGM